MLSQSFASLSFVVAGENGHIPVGWEWMKLKNPWIHAMVHLKETERRQGDVHKVSQHPKEQKERKVPRRSENIAV